MHDEMLTEWIRETRRINLARSSEMIDLAVNVEDLIPHRHEMLLIDRLTRIGAQRDVLAAKRKINPDDPVLRGHFEGDPVYPGVLLVEAMSQAGVCLVKLATQGGAPGAGADLKVRAIKILYAEFIKEVRPGDALDIEVKTFEVSSFLSVFGGRIVRNEELCAIAVVEVYVGE